jgi:hypothetical protein
MAGAYEHNKPIKLLIFSSRPMQAHQKMQSTSHRTVPLNRQNVD